MFVQRGGHLFLCLSNHRSMYAGLFRFGPIRSAIDNVPAHLSIGFRSWRVVRWIGEERLVLWSTKAE
jgi:hypothetical protein